MRAWRFLLPLLCLLAAATSWTPGFAGSPADIEVRSQIIRAFRYGSSETQFGPLEFVGGLQLSSSHRDFGSFSSFRFIEPGRRIVGVTDNGFWFTAAIDRGEEDRPTGFSQFTLDPIPGIKKPGTPKHLADAESIAVKGSTAAVGFERTHRIVQFAIAPDGRPLRAERDIDPLIPRKELRANGGFESLAYAPEKSALAGALVVISEESLDQDGNVLAAILEGPRKDIFTVTRSNSYNPTDAAFLPNGDLLLLERRLSLSGLSMRLRRLPSASIRPGAVADGPVILEANMGHQIDNMEGLDVWRAPDGALMVSLMSDDNQSFFQRTIYLEFRYIGE